jgi:hypothetical protein
MLLTTRMHCTYNKDMSTRTKGRLYVRCTFEEKEKWELYAQRAGLTLSEWIRDKLGGVRRDNAKVESLPGGGDAESKDQEAIVPGVLGVGVLPVEIDKPVIRGLPPEMPDDRHCGRCKRIKKAAGCPACPMNNKPGA